MRHFKLQPCKYENWLRFDSWLLRQAVFILTGNEPPPIQFLTSTNQRIGEEFSWDEPPEYRYLYDLAKNSVANGTLTYRYEHSGHYHGTHIAPVTLLEWAKGKQIAVPEQLSAAIEAKQAEGNALIDNAAIENEKKEQAKKTQNAPIGTRERETVHTIIAGFLVQGFSTSDIAQPYVIAREIEQALQSAGLELSDDTIAKWVKEAAGLLVRKEKTPNKS